jgi:hypothetical protein
LKADGTLWRLGTNVFDFYWNHLQTNWPSVRDFKPQKIGTNSDWKEIFGDQACYARKIDGSVWSIYNPNYYPNRNEEFERCTNLDQVVLKTFSQLNDARMAYVGDDGTLWIGDSHLDEHVNGSQSWSSWQEGTGFSQVGRETNWRAVAMTWNCMVALKSDGSLWKWTIPEKSTGAITTIPPTRLGIHNDWVGLTRTWGGVAALAADGSLWLWPGLGGYGGALMKAPKQPQLLGNVFGNNHEVAAIREVKGQP